MEISKRLDCTTKAKITESDNWIHNKVNELAKKILGENPKRQRIYRITGTDEDNNTFHHYAIDLYTDEPHVFLKATYINVKHEIEVKYSA